MAKVCKFNKDGYDITILDKKDIIDCIDSNIVDKEVLLELITKCERDAISFISRGKWTGIPYLGNIRLSKYYELNMSKEQRQLIDDAKQTLDIDNYILFRKQLNSENGRFIKYQRLYNWKLSMMVKKLDKLYKKLIKKEKSELWTRIYIYSFHKITVEEDISWRYSYGRQ